MSSASPQPKYRPMAFGVPRVLMREGASGVRYLRGEPELLPYAPTMGERLAHWARVAPDRTLFARRERHADGSAGDWQHLSFAQALDGARRIGQALIDRGLNAERPVVMLSENDLDHALLSLACLYVGVPYCSTSPAYSTISTDHGKLKHVMATLTPGLVFASDGARYAKAIDAAVPADCDVVLSQVNGYERASGKVFTFAELLATEATATVDEAAARVTPDTIAKFLFTSGSTKLPKAVINTHRMWCANQQQMRQSMTPLTQDPLVLVDWLPWNHTFGGNHNFGMVVYNGGTLYIDDGKPVPALMGETLRNLREIAPTVYFNVPTGFEVIADVMKTDDVLRKNLLSRVRMFFYAAAALSQPIWDALHECQEREIGERIVMCTGLGMTESGPFALSVNSANVKAGDLGVPTPGLEIKLVDVDGKTEVRYKGPNITPGYWRSPEATQEAFDEEGFFCSGDAVTWIDPDDIHKGLRFDGRIAEDFKLSTGTFVSVGPMRSKVIAAGAPYVQDVVLTGLNLKEVGAMIFPTQHVRTLSGLPATAPMVEVLNHPDVVEHFQFVINELAKTATGSATRIARAVLLSDPPSIDLGEITDKGSINQRMVLKHRDALVQALHADTAPNILKPQA
ncbi:feruloyl-CoA synthase [Hydrogenophaga palleronii]|uniref:Feruloyl-CoA synthase n=1 Tax=Hydrogenophaga palleronii TaxID=65655 RepID=A0ABU1WIA2_9BURK|nr:feruloyl-CoA synthase [Hydrogenophaga palleronii]MDR7149007.1 feruloyl-CoA synthase [Hydrogenophaga palleronii]